MTLFATWKRRYAHPGVYLYRTRKHMRPGTEWGYGGKSRRLDLRQECHGGTCTRHPGCAGGKPWSDLVVKRYTLELPWWLGFDWITLPIETAMIWVFRPRYNDKKNPRRFKTGTYAQRAQRHARETAPNMQQTWQSYTLAYNLIKAGALVTVLTVTGGFLWTR